MTDGNSLNVPLSQIERISFSAVTDTTPPEGAIEMFPGDDIQAIVDANPEGTTFILKSGTHRLLTEIWPKEGNTFWGESGAVLNGSKELTEFEMEGGLYYTPNQTQQTYNIEDINFEYCQEGWERCAFPEDLYFDNEPLHHVGNLINVTEGKWFFDYEADRIYFADDPIDHSLETSVTNIAFIDNSNNVTIQNLIIEKFASSIGHGAVGYNGSSSGWIVEGNEIRLNHGNGIVVGSNSVVRENYIHHNGNFGIEAGAVEGISRVSNILYEANEISYNNYAHVMMIFGGGGTKFSLSDDIRVIGNYVHHNLGIGLWTDIINNNTLYEGNWVWWNEYAGIAHEVSHDVIIRNNDVRYNGINNDIWLWGSQILIHVSDGAEVLNNTIFIHENGGNGIGVMNYNRPDHGGGWLGMNNYIHHNEITHLGLYGIHGIVDDGEVGTEYYYDGDGDGTADWGCRADEANNLFDYNAYHHNGIPEKFEFCETWYLTWEQFRAEGQEPNGTMDSNVIVPDDTPPQVCPICPGI
jgi:hypothetical protein